jgi:DNA-binding response OmpR family regulator
MSEWDLEDTIAENGSRRRAASAATRKKLLLVDDSETVLMMEQMVLGRERYHLLMARDGQEAVETAIRERPDLILLDVMMPRMNGFEACVALRANEVTKDVPIILVTTRSEGENVEAGFRHGCTDYVNKPFSAPELVAKVRTALGE